MLLGFGDDGGDVILVVERKHAAEGVGAEVFDEGLGDGVAVGDEQLLERHRVLEGAAVGHFAGGDDRRVGAEAGRDFLLGAPLADGVVVIPCEAERVDLGVAGGAVGVLGVSGQLVAQGGLGALRSRGFDRRHVGGRGRGRLAEDRLAEPDAAVDRTVAGAIGGQAEHGAHSEEAAAVVLGLERDALEAFGLRFGQAVEIAEAAVRHRPVGVDEGVDGQVLAEHFAEVFDDLAAHARLEPGIVVRVEFLVGREHADAVELEPLAGEVVDEAAGALVREQAVDLLAKVFALELAGLGRGEETVVRHRAPDEVGEARSEFPVRELFAGLRLAFDEIDEVARRQHALEGDAVGLGGFLAGGPLGGVGFDVLSHLFGGDRAAPGAFGEHTQFFGGGLRGGVIGGEQALAARFLRRRLQRTFPLDPIDEHRGEDAVPLVVEHLRGVAVQQLFLAAVGEEIAGAAEDVAEGRAGPAVDDIGGHHAEVQLRRHVEIDIELVHFGAVLGRVDVEFDEAGDGLFAGRLTDAEVRRLAADGADAAGFQAETIEAAVFRSELAEPLGGQGGLDAAGEEQLTERALDAELIQRRLGFLQVAIMHLAGGLAHLAGFGGGRREGAVEHGFGGAVVAIHVRRRKREGRADALEAMPEGVFVQAARDGGVVAGAEQVVDRVLILFTAEAIMGHGRTRRHARCAAFLQGSVEACHKGGDLRLGRLGFLVLLRRHLAGVHLLHGFRPVMGVGAQLEVARELVEAQVAFFLLRSVAAGAVLLDERFVGLRRLRDTIQAEAEHEQGKGFEGMTGGGHGT